MLSPLAFAAAAPAVPWLPVFICQHFLCSDCYQSLSRNSSCHTLWHCCRSCVLCDASCLQPCSLLGCTLLLCCDWHQWILACCFSQSYDDNIHSFNCVLLQTNNMESGGFSYFHAVCVVASRQGCVCSKYQIFYMPPNNRTFFYPFNCKRCEFKYVEIIKRSNK